MRARICHRPIQEHIPCDVSPNIQNTVGYRDAEKPVFQAQTFILQLRVHVKKSRANTEVAIYSRIVSESFHLWRIDAAGKGDRPYSMGEEWPEGPLRRGNPRVTS